MLNGGLLRISGGLVGLVLVGGVLIADTASAQPINGRARWCITMSQYGGTLDCAYHSLEQCMAAASGVSNQCSLNPWFVEPSDRRTVPRDWRR
jgi:hypothetical protein